MNHVNSNKKTPIELWESVIEQNLPNTLPAAKICLAVVGQLFIENISNPFALVLVDVPSSSKTLTLDHFNGLTDLIHGTDQFSASSFVSHAANVSADKLSKIDLLPRITGKTLIVRDMATVFSDKQDVLEQNLGILTRVLDGNGLRRESGVHGSRGYDGDYVFMMLAATTPLRNKIWEVMGGIGARLFFYNTRQPDFTEDELIAQVTDGSLKDKRKACQESTVAFFTQLKASYPDKLTWDRSKEDQDLLRLLSKAAVLLARARGIAKDDPDEEGIFTQAEQPSRLNQLLYNLSCGHALVNGRTQIALEDVKIAIEVAIESSPPQRSLIIKHLVENNGSASSNDLADKINRSKPGLLRLVEKLVALRVIERGRNSTNPIEPDQIKLCDEFLRLCELFPHKSELF